MQKNLDLTSSNIQRQNILNNRYAMRAIEEEYSFYSVLLDGEQVFTKQQVAHILEVDERTIDRYISSNIEELSKNGYELIKGARLKEFKGLHHVDDINVVDISKVPQLGVFTFKTVLNLAMLLVESDKARQIRSRILDIVIDTITKKAGDRKYINQRDEDYLPAAFQEENYRKEFTDAIDLFIDSSSSWKYPKYTNMVYKAIFAENTREYREILNLKSQDKVRDTFYTEALDLISSFEVGFAEKLKEESAKLGRKLTLEEASSAFDTFSKQAAFKPLINKVRTAMASRDYSLRDAIHDKLLAYIQEMPKSDYERFLGEKSKDLNKRIEESLDVYKRLKDR